MPLVIIMIQICLTVNNYISFNFVHHGQYTSRKKLIPKEKMVELATTFMNDLTVDEIKASALNL